MTPESGVAVAGTAAVAWRTTPWDADGLGVAATLELTAIDGAGAELATALAAIDAVAAARDAALATTRVPAAATATRAALAAADYAEVERSRALSLDLRAVDPRRRFARPCPIEVATRADAPTLAALAADGFDYSRYHEDRRIHPSRARARFRRWIVDSLGNGDEVWIHRHHGALVALMSFRRRGDRVQLWLGGVRRDVAMIAPMFWAAVLGRLRDQGVAAVDTRVSVANAGAVRLHDAFGFVAADDEVGATKLYASSRLATALPSTADRT